MVGQVNAGGCRALRRARPAALLPERAPPSGDTWYTLAFSAFPAVGVVIASRRPRNPIGWLFCSIGLANGMFFFVDEYVVYALTTLHGGLPGAPWLAWSQLWTVFVMWGSMFFCLLLFPTGRLPSTRWRPVAWALAGVFALVTVLFGVKPGPLEGVAPAVDNTTGIEAAAGIVGAGEEAVLPDVLIVVLTAPAAILVRFWRSRGEDVYDQGGRRVESVEDLYIDRQEREVRFLEVGTGGFLGIGQKRFLVPVEAIVMVAEEWVAIEAARTKRVEGSAPFDTKVAPPPADDRRADDYASPPCGSDQEAADRRGYVDSAFSFGRRPFR